MVLINDPIFSFSSRWRSFSSLWCSQSNQWFPLVAGCHLIVLRCFHKPTTSLFFSLLVFQQLRYNLLGRVLSKLSCGRSWHFLLHSVVPMIYLVFFLPEALWCCSLHSSSRIEYRVLFSSSFHLIKSCISFQPECCPILIFLVPCLSRFNQSDFNSFLSIVLVIHSFATFKSS